MLTLTNLLAGLAALTAAAAPPAPTDQNAAKADEAQKRAKPDKPQPTSKKAPKRRRRRKPAAAPVEDTPGLPRVLLIGDSISIHYTLPTRRLLKGKVNLHRIPVNGGPTTRGLEHIDAWLGKKKWDVIHFNWGLHDLKYMGPKGQNLADPKAVTSRQQVPADQYEKNLRQLVRRLKATGAKLIWASTTPVPAGSRGRVQGDAAKYNRIARKIMEAEGVAVDDLYAFALPRLKQLQQPRNVHFRPAGSQQLARRVANSILTALGKEKLPEPKTQPAKNAKPRT